MADPRRPEAVVQLARAKKTAEVESEEAPDPTLLLSNMVALMGIVSKVELMSIGAIFLALSAFCKRGPSFDWKNFTMAMVFAVMGTVTSILNSSAKAASGGK